MVIACLAPDQWLFQPWGLHLLPQCCILLCRNFVRKLSLILLIPVSKEVTISILLILKKCEPLKIDAKVIKLPELSFIQNIINHLLPFFFFLTRSSVSHEYHYMQMLSLFLATLWLLWGPSPNYPLIPINEMEQT